MFYIDCNIPEHGNPVHLKCQIRIVSIAANYEDNKKIVLGLLGTSLITFCSQNNYNNKVASIIITLRGIDIRFHEFQVRFYNFLLLLSSTPNPLKWSSTRKETLPSISWHTGAELFFFISLCLIHWIVNLLFHVRQRSVLFVSSLCWNSFLSSIMKGWVNLVQDTNRILFLYVRFVIW